ncbi:Serine/threonine-protein kinase PknA [Nonomuraea coxensis DSM 45129]|uniref:non-specific serine/threonine protein kinase n=1 Tax=Nonomuraea coxensis DSM 45129 TaxID=1122611 RepID=A0ABX8U0Q7_9ACTN|nr:serine/threonine-protein kinase [Nonomuraea coxensis]QYC40546.1 Serine/threonine-protein kinase PknA [Nonomuraea coxensis DSM 45129]
MSAGRLAGRYSLLRPLGAGGMGKVWLARDEMLDRDVAVKELTLPEGMAPKERADSVKRAVREAQATARLRHPGIVALHDVVVENDRPWLVMELLRGRTLGDTVREFGPMPAEHAARVGADVLEALTAAHAQGMQHRDVKPGNVFLTESGRVVLTDFGIARQEGQATLTEQGLMIGSPGFIAPERLEGRPGGPAADLWSLGATLYVAVAGVPAYGGSAAQRVQATLLSPPPVAPGPLGPLIAAMMAHHPAARPGPRAVVSALRQVAAGRPLPELPADQSVTVPGKAPGRGRAVVWVAASVALAAVLAAGGFLAVRGLSGGDDVPAAFTAPMDVCTLLAAEEVGRLLLTAAPPEPQPGSDEVGPKCGWPVSGSGVGLQVQKDSDTVDPWSMTPATARTLFQNQRRYWGKYTSVDWTWPEIGVKTSRKATLTPIRPIAGVGEEAFGFELKGPTGRVHSAHVYYRLANLVVSVEYSTLSDRPTDEDVRQTALKAARASEQALRHAA